MERATDDRTKSSLAVDVYNKLIDKFLRNELVPGSILKRREVADELGVSVAPVLEAFVLLEREGFIESIPRKGTLVKAIHQEDIFGHLMLREAIECQAARLYCGEAVRRNKDRLKRMAEAVDKEAPGREWGGEDKGEGPQLWQSEIDFHAALVELSNCEVLLREFKHVMRLGIFYRVNRVINPLQKKEHRSHVQLLEGLMSESPDEAAATLRVHLRSGKPPIFD